MDKAMSFMNELKIAEINIDLLEYTQNITFLLVELYNS